MKVKDKVCVVTGAAGGIGEAIARRFVSEGAKGVVVADRDAARLEKVARDIGGLAVAGDSAGGNLAAAVRRQVQQQRRAVADGLKIQIKQLRGRLHFRVLTRVIKPAGADGDIAFAGNPIRAVALAGIQAFLVRAGKPAGGIQRVPKSFAGGAVFVADPMHIRSGVAEHARLRLQGADDGTRVRPVIIILTINGALLLRAAVKTVAAVRAVEPHLKNRPVVRH